MSISSLLLRLFAPPPILAETESARVAYKIYQLVIVLLVASFISWAGLFLLAPELGIYILPSFLLFPCFVSTLMLLRRGRIYAACLLIVIGVWLVLAGSAILQGSILSPAYTGLIVVTLTAGLLLGRQAALICAASSILIGLGLVIGTNLGIFHALTRPSSPIEIWFLHAVFLLSSWGVFHIATSSTAESLERAQAEIHERKLIEQRLREREQDYRMAIDAADAVSYYYDFAKGRYTFIGENISKMTGYPTDEVTPQLMTEIEVMSMMRGSAAHLSSQEAIALARSGQLKEWRCDTLIRTRSGELRWLADSAIQVFDQHHNVLGSFGILQDITERKLAEEQIRQAQKLQIVGQLAGGLSHDFNNLLTIILSYTDAMLDQAREQQLPQWLQQDLEQIQHASLRAATLTRQLLAFSRRQVLNPRIIKLNSVIENLIPILSRLVGPTIHLRSTLDPELVSVHVDPSQIEQVVINLVTNARDALPHGGDIVIASQNLYLSVPNPHYPHLEPGIYAMVSVHDTGSGILPEVQSRIFEPFFTTKEQGRGTGLGLATAHGILKQSGGQIWFESMPERGTTFFFCLPNTTGSTDQQEDQPTKPKAPNLGTSTIILVEDDTAVRLLTRTILERNGFRVIEATPEEAEAYAKDTMMQFDMMLTDIMMPGIDGVELSRRMLAERPMLPILFMSGYTDTLILNSDTRAGRSDFLQKPFTPSTLIAKVRGVLHAANEDPIP